MMLVLTFNWDIMEQRLYNGKCYNHEEDLGNLDTSNNIQDVLSIYAETEKERNFFFPVGCLTKRKRKTRFGVDSFSLQP